MEFIILVFWTLSKNIFFNLSINHFLFATTIDGLSGHLSNKFKLTYLGITIRRILPFLPWIRRVCEVFSWLKWSLSEITPSTLYSRTKFECSLQKDYIGVYVRLNNNDLATHNIIGRPLTEKMIKTIKSTFIFIFWCIKYVLNTAILFSSN